MALFEKSMIHLFCRKKELPNIPSKYGSEFEAYKSMLFDMTEKLSLNTIGEDR